MAFVLAGFERAFIILMHLCLTLLIFYYVKTRDKKYIGIAVFAHFVVVAASALTGQMGIPLVSVAVTAAVAMALAVYAQRCHKEYEAQRPMGEYAVIE